ncbi:MAG: lysophospholipid acyltransferase family protein [Lautropia sp.]
MRLPFDDPTAQRHDRLAADPPDVRRVPPARTNPLRAAFDSMRLGLAWLAVGTTFLGWCLAAWLLHPLLAPAVRRRIGRRVMHRGFAGCLALCERLGLLCVDNAALDALRGERRLILAPNHPTMMDVMLVIGRLDDVNCIMKADLWDNPFLGAGARMAGFIRNDSARSMIRLAVDDLARGSRLLVFPEATRTVRPPVNPMSSGFALIAKKARAPVQTILIETDSPYLRKGWPLLRRPPLPIRFTVRLGERFEADDDTDRLVAAVERHYREALGE